MRDTPGGHKSRRMTHLPVTRRWGPDLVVLFTITWTMASLASVGRCLAIGMSAWAAEQSDGAHSVGLPHQAAIAEVMSAGVAVCGAALIATVAFANRMPRTSNVYVVLTVILGALPVVAGTNGSRLLLLGDEQGQQPGRPPDDAPGSRRESAEGVGCQVVVSE